MRRLGLVFILCDDFDVTCMFFSRFSARNKMVYRLPFLPGQGHNGVSPNIEKPVLNPSIHLVTMYHGFVPRGVYRLII